MKVNKMDNNKIDQLFDDIFNDIIKYTKSLNLLYVEDNKDSRESGALMLMIFLKV